MVGPGRRALGTQQPNAPAVSQPVLWDSVGRGASLSILSCLLSSNQRKERVWLPGELRQSWGPESSLLAWELSQACLVPPSEDPVGL